MGYFNLKFRVDFLGRVKNVRINTPFFTVFNSVARETNGKPILQPLTAMSLLHKSGLIFHNFDDSTDRRVRSLLVP